MRKLIWIILLTAVLPFKSAGQTEKFYYGANTKPVEKMEEAVEYSNVYRKSERRYTIKTYKKGTNNWILVNKERIRIRQDGSQTVYYNRGTFFPRKFYRVTEKLGPNKYSFKETTSGKTIRTGTSSSFLPLHLEGLVSEYHSNGMIKSKSFYSDNQLLSNENWLNDGTKYIDSVFYSVDKEPEYQPGDGFFKKYLIQNLVNSKMDLTQFEDEVVIGWVVLETGKVDGAIALKGKSRQLNEFLVKTINELPGEWTPAELNGNKVRYFMSIPLNFIHNETNFQDVEFSSGVLHYNTY